MKRPTIVDVAREAGVSKSTVSLVLNDSALVTEPRRTAVRAAMARLGYVYNRAAAQLRSDRVGLIGLVINDLRNPFFTEFAASLQETLAARGYATVIANSNEDPAAQAVIVTSMIEHGVSALVVSPAYGDGAGAALRAGAGVPTLTVLRPVPGARLPFASFDYAEGSWLALAHLRGLGVTRIAFVGGLEGRPVTAERMAGVAGTPLALVLHGRPTRAFGRAAAPRLAAEGIDAVLCFNDAVALGLADGLADAGRAVGPGGVRLVGFDDIEDAAQARPPLTSVHCDIAGFGRSVADLLLQWVVEGRPPPDELRLPVRLVVRASTVGP